MRFHKFQLANGGTAYIDLEAIVAVEAHKNHTNIIGKYRERWRVVLTEGDAASLFESGPGAPDTYEEALRAHRELAQGGEALPLLDSIKAKMRAKAEAREAEDARDAWLNRPLVDAEVKDARLDEIARFWKWYHEPGNPPEGLRAYFDRRRAQIERGEA